MSSIYLFNHRKGALEAKSSGISRRSRCTEVQRIASALTITHLSAAGCYVFALYSATTLSVLARLQWSSYSPAMKAMLLTKSSSVPALLLFSGSLHALKLPQNSDNLFAVSTPYNLSSSELRLISTLNNYTATPGPAPLLNLTVPDVPPVSNDIKIHCSFGRTLTP